MTNLAIPWLESAQKRQEHGDRLDGLKGAQLRAYLAGHLKTGSGSNKRLASHYKQWVKVELPESEARQHLPLHHLPEQLVRNAASPSPSSQAVHAAPEPYKAQVRRGGKKVHLGSFATAEEAALCIARSPEGQAAAVAAASEEGNTSAMPSGATLKVEGAVPRMPPGAFVKEEHVPPLPPDAVVKQEHEAIVKEEERSRGGMKRQRNT